MTTYPLAQLLQLWQSNVRQLEQQLVCDLTSVNDAESRVAALEIQRESLLSSLAAEQRRQFARALQGATLVQDFVQGAAHMTQQQREQERLQLLKAAAVTELDGCIAIACNTEQLLAKARRQLAAIERHHQRFLKRQSQLHEARVEEDAAEVWQAAITARRSDGGN